MSIKLNMYYNINTHAHDCEHEYKYHDMTVLQCLYTFVIQYKIKTVLQICYVNITTNTIDVCTCVLCANRRGSIAFIP